MTPKVLLAEDLNLIRSGVRALLEHSGKVEIVGEAADGREAVKLAQKLMPDIVLMDVAMPEMNGIEATRQIRKAFPDTAYWSPSVHTDAAGHAHVTLTFPDSLTTWRTTVHAITLDSKAGSAINRVLVRKNIIVRMGMPRFLRQGDEITIPVIVHNYLDQAKQVQVSLDIRGVDPVAGAPQSVTVPSKGEGTVLWRVKASHIGTATLLAKALTRNLAVAAAPMAMALLVPVRLVAMSVAVIVWLPAVSRVALKKPVPLVMAVFADELDGRDQKTDDQPLGLPAGRSGGVLAQAVRIEAKR